MGSADWTLDVTGGRATDVDGAVSRGETFLFASSAADSLQLLTTITAYEVTTETADDPEAGSNPPTTTTIVAISALYDDSSNDSFTFSMGGTSSESATGFVYSVGYTYDGAGSAASSVDDHRVITVQESAGARSASLADDSQVTVTSNSSYVVNDSTGAGSSGEIGSASHRYDETGGATYQVDTTSTLTESDSTTAGIARTETATETSQNSGQSNYTAWDEIQRSSTGPGANTAALSGGQVASGSDTDDYSLSTTTSVADTTIANAVSGLLTQLTLTDHGNAIWSSSQSSTYNLVQDDALRGGDGTSPIRTVDSTDVYMGTSTGHRQSTYADSTLLTYDHQPPNSFRTTLSVFDGFTENNDFDFETTADGSIVVSVEETAADIDGDDVVSADESTVVSMVTLEDHWTDTQSNGVRVYGVAQSASETVTGTVAGLTLNSSVSDSYNEGATAAWSANAGSDLFATTTSLGHSANGGDTVADVPGQSSDVVTSHDWSSFLEAGSGTIDIHSATSLTRTGAVAPNTTINETVSRTYDTTNGTVTFGSGFVTNDHLNADGTILSTVVASSTEDRVLPYVSLDSASTLITVASPNTIATDQTIYSYERTNSTQEIHSSETSNLSTLGTPLPEAPEEEPEAESGEESGSGGDEEGEFPPPSVEIRDGYEFVTQGHEEESLTTLDDGEFTLSQQSTQTSSTAFAGFTAAQSQTVSYDAEGQEHHTLDQSSRLTFSSDGRALARNRIEVASDSQFTSTTTVTTSHLESSQGPNGASGRSSNSTYQLDVGQNLVEQSLVAESTNASDLYLTRTLEEDESFEQIGQSWTLDVTASEFAPGQSLDLTVEGDGGGDSSQARHLEENYAAAGGVVLDDSSFESRDYADSGHSDVTTSLALHAFSLGEEDTTWNADFDLEFVDNQDFDRYGLWSKTKATDGTVTIVDGADQTITGFRSSDFNFQLTGTFADGAGTSGNYQIDATQQTVSSTFDHQARQNGVLVGHEYSEGWSNSGALTLSVAVSGNGFGFGFTMDTGFSNSRTKDGDLAHEDASGSSAAHAHKSYSSSLTDGSGNTTSQSGQVNWDYSRSFDLTRYFSGQGANRSVTDVAVRQFDDSYTDTRVSDGETSTSSTATEYQNGELVTTTSNSDPEAGGGTSSAPVTADWATGQATGDWGLTAPSLAYALAYVPWAHPAGAALGLAMGGGSESTPENPTYAVTTHPDGSRSEWWDDGQSWWYGEFDAAGNLIHEEEGDFANTGPTGAAALANLAAHAAQDNAGYQPAEIPESALGIVEVEDSLTGNTIRIDYIGLRRMLPGGLVVPGLVAGDAAEYVGMVEVGAQLQEDMEQTLGRLNEIKDQLSSRWRLPLSSTELQDLLAERDALRGAYRGLKTDYDELERLFREAGFDRKTAVGTSPNLSDDGYRGDGGPGLEGAIRAYRRATTQAGPGGVEATGDETVVVEIFSGAVIARGAGRAIARAGQVTARREVSEETMKSLQTLAWQQAKNGVKGSAGELAAMKTLVRAGYTRLKSKLPGNRGIDGVWIKRNARGEIDDILIVESKARENGKGALKNTKSGKQMSGGWIKERLDKMADSGDPDLIQTAAIVQNFIDAGGVVRKKINVLDRFGRNRWSVLPPPDGGTYQ